MYVMVCGFLHIPYPFISITFQMQESALCKCVFGRHHDAPSLYSTIHTVSVWYKQQSVDGANVMRDTNFPFFVIYCNIPYNGATLDQTRKCKQCQKVFLVEKTFEEVRQGKNKEKTTTTMIRSFPLKNLRCLSSKTQVTIKASSSDLGHYKRLSRYPQVTINS